jgi:6-phosphogluconolactonase
MKFSQFGRITLAAVVLTAMSFTITACSVGHAVDYIYVATAKSSVIYGYNVDNDTGSLTDIGNWPSGGTDPVAEVTSPNGKYLYVANKTSSTISVFTINASDGTLSAGTSVSLPGTGTLPTHLATDPEGLNLLAVYTYKAGSSGTGGIAVYPISSSGSLGTGTAYSVGNSPVGLNVTEYVESNHMYYTYVADQTDAQIVAFSFNASTGVLTPVGSYAAGVAPTAVTSGPSAKYVYVTDSASNQLIGYDIQSNGSLVSMIDSPFTTGSYPSAVVVDPRGEFLYVTNYNSATIAPYAINVTTGELSSIAVTSSNNTVATGTYPTAILSDPALGEFLYTANFLDNSVTALQYDSHTGQLTAVQNTPFNTGGQPDALAGVAAGNHLTQLVQP